MAAKPIVYQPRPATGKRKVSAMLRRTPTPAWADEIRAGRVKKFPPPAEHAPMVQCRSGQLQCGGRFYPAAYVKNGVCEDCHNNDLLALREHRQEHGLLAGDDTDPNERHPLVYALAELLFAMKAKGHFPTTTRRSGGAIVHQKPHLHNANGERL